MSISITLEIPLTIEDTNHLRAMLESLKQATSSTCKASIPHEEDICCSVHVVDHTVPEQKSHSRKQTDHHDKQCTKVRSQVR